MGREQRQLTSLTLDHFWRRRHFLEAHLADSLFAARQQHDCFAVSALWIGRRQVEPDDQCDINHIHEIGPVLFFARTIRCNSENEAMTSLPGISRITAIALGAALSMTAGLAFAADNSVSADQIVNALKPKPLTRSLSAEKPNPVVQAKEDSFIDSLRNRKTRSLSLGERDKVAELSAIKTKIDLDIQFEYNSARISEASLPAVQELGKALSDPALKGSTFVVAGHTDAVGGEAFNQDLSERRADTIKRYLGEKYGIAGSELLTVGYGKTRLKDPSAPTAAVNRRVQVVNLDGGKTAAK
jgi:outer membrane protein OmpA-like peptidoglycan-associated protein